MCPVLDARKGEVYTALFYRHQNGQFTRLSSDQVVTPGAFFTELESPCLFIGDGIEKYEELLLERCGPAIRLLPFSEYYPRGSVIALMAWERLRRGESDDIVSLIPSYVRKPEAEFKRIGQG